MKPQTYQFIGCDTPYEEANTVIFGVPFDGTTSYRPGTRFGPSHIRNESFGIETYSPYQDLDLLDYKVFDAGDLECPFGNPVSVLDEIQNFTKTILDDNKKPLMLGGEHLISLGMARALVDKYPNLKIVHLDAHCDLRDEYLGEKLSHATVMRRIYELVEPQSILQFGIRSGDAEEFAFAKEHVMQTRFNTEGFKEKLEMFKGYPIYFTLDLDVLDPSQFSGTGTPEAGGIDFLTLITFIKDLNNYNIVGADINELSPIYDPSQASTALACKVVRELLLTFKGEQNV